MKRDRERVLKKLKADEAKAGIIPSTARLTHSFVSRLDLLPQNLRNSPAIFFNHRLGYTTLGGSRRLRDHVRVGSILSTETTCVMPFIIQNIHQSNRGILLFAVPRSLQVDIRTDRGANYTCVPR